MKAAVFVGKEQIELEERPVPVPGPRDVVIRVKVASICGTDLKIFRNGHFKIPMGTKRVLSHEISGIISEVGTEVSEWWAGDRVTVTPNIGCGSCRQCRSGLNQMCPDYEAFGISIDGGMQEYMLIPGWAIARGNLFKLPDSISYEVGALLEPASCCLSGLRKLGVGGYDRVLIIGAGPIGCIHAQIAKALGAPLVAIANSRPQRLSFADAADIKIDLSLQSIEEQTKLITDGEGFDAVVTAVAKTEVVSDAVSLMARHGRMNVFSGLGNLPLPVIDVNSLHYKAQTITGTTGSSNLDYQDVMAMAEERRIDLLSLITNRFSLEEVNDAMVTAASGTAMKTVITFDGD
jgi:2-desacetyl-2-hydroxyethyl bacteriochlorophyllide A dehydrogenase